MRQAVDDEVGWVGLEGRGGEMTRVMSQERRTDRGAGAQAMSTGRNDAARSDENACIPGWLIMG